MTAPMTIPDEAVQAMPERIYAKVHGASTDVISGQRGLIGGWNEHKRDGQTEFVRADLAAPFLQGVKVKALGEDDYEVIIDAAAKAMRKATSGVRGQTITVHDCLDWWVMKATENHILSALEPSAARELALEEIIALCKDYAEDSQPDSEYRLACNDIIEAIQECCALSSPDHADADHAQARDVLARFRDYVIEGITAGTIMRGGEHHNPIWQEVASVLHADADKVEGDGWLPIESAPKDGTYVLACRAHSILPLIIRFDEKYGEWESEQGDHVYNILGWRPLPTTPEAAK